VGKGHGGVWRIYIHVYTQIWKLKVVTTLRI
jgi:hypothetical protein